ncbi:signal peptidase I [Lactococcus carnosus]|uniref:signal peptidase I n=1 Tax=Pseudolactococcus carnosus TaxID=2749961 RepID=UPI000BC8C907|nr:signal peptidase I [Lactococcus carnosus]MCJ1968540.1 signal peptidase I [Lactococcus carnosus]MCJ1973518.1 signal peptidase I [Lactococcus carnosus]MCJ2001686.1 signal peptidase I [Lactococcus carnosus]SOB48120.1 Signal peptidase I [Lactococcus piscium]
MVKRDLYRNILVGLIAIGILLIIRFFVFEPIRIHNNNMSPILPNKTQVFAMKRTKLENLDLVAYQHNGKKYVGRIIGTPGQSVVAMDNVVYLNQIILTEPYIKQNQASYLKTHDDDFTTDFRQDKLAAKTYWILNDARDVKADSRTFGAIKQKDILGELKFKYAPISEFGFVENDEAKIENGFDTE